MSGIGQTLKDERTRQGRTLPDAAAETRVRESYLAALEEEDFDVLGGDVYARGFIRLYAKYLSLDAEALVEHFRAHHERPQEVTAIPGATIEEVMAPMGGLPRLLLTPPVLAAVGVVLVLTVLFVFARSGGGEDELDPNAPGPSPAAATPADVGVPDAPATPTPALDPTAAAIAQAPVGDGTVLETLEIVVRAVQPVQLTVLRGQPPVSGATLQPGDSRTLIDPQGQQVTFTVSDFSAAEITVNGDVLLSAELAGRAVEISCTVGQSACDATPR